MSLNPYKNVIKMLPFLYVHFARKEFRRVSDSLVRPPHLERRACGGACRCAGARAHAGNPGGAAVAEARGTSVVALALAKGGAGGDSSKKDREGLHLLGDAGLPVAPILAEGPDYFVTPDLGVTLRALMAGGGAPDDRLAAFAAAGSALAALHVRGFSHGRPAVRNLCWDGAAVRFIDMERFSPRRHHPRHFAADVLVFVHSVFAAAGGAAELDRAITAYRTAGGPWAASVALARRLRWALPAVQVLQPLAPRAREVAALAPTLAYVTAAR